ncbi:E3 ubiquitin-protein ligase MARCHF2 isoform X1 [Pelecanus crispus]|uniref:E3 ubiquitin-protein ligase MARCHF2 isoform X1 n=1 Tax=Pelecanus crispus TaxID=36300 RepID=UPI003F5CFB04
MTTGDCCHLPGSLCDCPGSAALSKSVEDSDIGRPQYVTQVTAKDGRLLSTVIKALGAQSDGPICRICHEGGNGEGLLSPCDCTGTLGTVHKSCLEKWLSSSNTSYCELCHTEFVVERRPRPLTEWLKDPGPRNEKRTLFCDMVCFLFITPLAAISGWLCLRGAQDHLQFNSRLEAIGLIALTIALFTIYVLWTLVSVCCPGPCFCSKGRSKYWLTPCRCSRLFLTPLVRKASALSLEHPFNYLQMGAAKVVAENEELPPDDLLSRLTWEPCSPGCHVPRCRHAQAWLGLGGKVWCSGQAVIQLLFLFLFLKRNTNLVPGWFRGKIKSGKCLTPKSSAIMSLHALCCPAQVGHA